MQSGALTSEPCCPFLPLGWDANGFLEEEGEVCAEPKPAGQLHDWLGRQAMPLPLQKPGARGGHSSGCLHDTPPGGPGQPRSKQPRPQVDSGIVSKPWGHPASRVRAATHGVRNNTNVGYSGCQLGTGRALGSIPASDSGANPSLPSRASSASHRSAPGAGEPPEHLDLHFQRVFVLPFLRPLGGSQLCSAKLGQLCCLLLHALLPPLNSSVLEPHLHLGGGQNRPAMRAKEGRPELLAPPKPTLAPLLDASPPHGCH